MKENKTKKALPYSSSTMFNAPPDELFIVGVDSIGKEAEKSALFEPERINVPIGEEFIASIDAKGILLNVLVAKDGDRLVVIAGKRRTLAARIVNERRKKEGRTDFITVPVVVKRGNEHELWSLMTTENTHRKNDSILTQSKQALKMVNAGMDVADVAVACGVSVASITSYLKIAELSPAVQEAIKENKVSPNAAMQLAALPESEQATTLDEILLTGEKPTAKEVNRVVEEKKSGVKAERTDDTPSTGELRKILRAMEAEPEEYTEEATLLLGIILGETKPSKLAWFSKLLKANRKKKKE